VVTIRRRHKVGVPNELLFRFLGFFLRVNHAGRLFFCKGVVFLREVFPLNSCSVVNGGSFGSRIR